MRKTFRAILMLVVVVVVVAFIYTRLDKTPPETAVSQTVLAWKSDGQVFEYQGNRISYHDSGASSKEVVVLLHGYPTSSYDWHVLWPELSANFRLVAMDMLGFGLSDKPDDIEYSISMQTDILEALLKSLDVGKVHILAHDYGDNVAQELLARRSEKRGTYSIEVDSLTLLNGGLFPETHRPTTIQSLLSSPIGGVIASFTSQSIFDKNFSRVFGPNTQPSKQDLIDHWYLICHQQGYRIANKLTHASRDREKNRERWVGALTSLDVPILYISGQRDPVTGIETVDRYSELVPNPNIVKLEEVGHFPQIEAPETVLSEVTAHIRKTRSLSDDLAP